MRRYASVVLLSALALSACSTFGTKPETKSSALSGGRYVAMGRSIAAGPGLGQIKPGTPQRCTRTFANYPTRLAERLRLTLFDVSCSGATTEHILGPWNELPAQIDAVTPDTKLVTVSIGGNDLNYVGGLLAASCGAEGTLSIDGMGSFPCPPRRTLDEADFEQVEANLREIARQVKQRAPGAKLAFVQYVTLVPKTLCAQTPIAEEEAAAARAIAAQLSTITAKVARESGAILVSADEFSSTHTPCDAEPWAIGFPRDFEPAGDGIPWHANKAGMEAVADMIAAGLES